MYAPDEAARAGYLDAVVPAEELLARARQEAARLGAFSASAFRATKQRLRGATIEHIRATIDRDLAALLPR